MGRENSRAPVQQGERGAEFECALFQELTASRRSLSFSFDWSSRLWQLEKKRQGLVAKGRSFPYEIILLMRNKLETFGKEGV